MNPLPPVPYSDDVEVIPADEEQTFSQIVDVMQTLMHAKSSRYGDRVRDVHVKSHGSVHAEFRVLDGLPPELAQGLFATPKAYSARIRFSNASPIRQSDLLPDGRGLAIKVDLKQPESGATTQDFLMANHPTFLARDAADYLQLQQLRVQLMRQGIFAVHRTLTGDSWNPGQWRWRAAWSAASVATQIPRHPAGYTYFSMTPFRYGNFVAKFRTQPHVGSEGSWLLSAAWQSDALHQALKKTLSERELRLEFQVQLRTLPETMPIEDATREWRDRESAYRTVAEIVIPKQKVIDLGDDLTFNVWHALDAHRPLGGINRSRRAAYAASVAWRKTEVDGRNSP